MSKAEETEADTSDYSSAGLSTFEEKVASKTIDKLTADEKLDRLEALFLELIRTAGPEKARALIQEMRDKIDLAERARDGRV